MKRTPEEWEEENGINIYDPDGWRRKFTFNGVTYLPQSWEVPITRTEWNARALMSTVIRKSK